MARSSDTTHKSNRQKELEAIYEEFHSKTLLEFDPLEFVYHYRDPFDQEAVAVFGALIAYGQVRQIRGSIQKVLQTIEEFQMRPGEFGPFLKSIQKGSRTYQKVLARFQSLYHRFNRGEDFLVLFELIGESRKKFGSVGEHFLSLWHPEDQTIEKGLEGLVQSWRYELESVKFPVRKSVEYLLTRPSDGSCCKRWCMLLRWLGREDEVDLGLWTKPGPLFPKKRLDFLRPDQLIVPLDTHTGRMSQSLGLTQARTLSWKSALEVTSSLKKLEPKDPLKFDFALCHSGIMKRILKTNADTSSSLD